MSKWFQLFFKINNVMDLDNFELIERLELTEASKIEDRDSYIYLKNKYGNRANELFVSFTAIPKLGINPQSKWDTPNGIYSYQISYYFKVHGRVEFKGSMSNEGKRYVNVFKPKDIISSKILDNDLTESQYQNYIDRIKKDKTLYNIALKNVNVNTSLDQLLNSGSNEIDGIAQALDFHIQKYEEQAKVKTPLGFLWNVTRSLSARYNSVNLKNTNSWTNLLIKLGIYGVIDNGEGIIHHNEKTQAVFFNISFLDVLDRIEDKELNIKIKNNRVNSNAILASVNAFMQYIKAHEGEYDNNKTIHFFSAISEDINIAANYFDANHEDFELLVIYLQLALANEYDLNEKIFQYLFKILDSNEPLIAILLNHFGSLPYKAIDVVARASVDLSNILYEYIKKSDYFMKKSGDMDVTEMVSASTDNGMRDMLLQMLMYALTSVHAKYFINKINKDFDNFIEHASIRSGFQIDRIIDTCLKDSTFNNKFIKWLPTHIEDINFNLESLYYSNIEIRNILINAIVNNGNKLTTITKDIDTFIKDHPEVKESIIKFILDEDAYILYNTYRLKNGLSLIKYCLDNFSEYRNDFIKSFTSKPIYGDTDFFIDNFSKIELLKMKQYSLIKELSPEEINYVFDNKNKIDIDEIGYSGTKLLSQLREDPRYLEDILTNDKHFSRIMFKAPFDRILKLLETNGDEIFKKLNNIEDIVGRNILFRIMENSDILLKSNLIDDLVQFIFSKNLLKDETVIEYCSVSKEFGIKMAKLLNDKIDAILHKANIVPSETLQNIIKDVWNIVIKYNTYIKDEKDKYPIPLDEISEDFKKYKEEKFPNLESASDMKSKLKNKLFTILNEVGQ